MGWMAALGLWLASEAGLPAATPTGEDVRATAGEAHMPADALRPGRLLVWTGATRLRDGKQLLDHAEEGPRQMDRAAEQPPPQPEP